MVERFKARIGRHEVMVERSELERLFGIQLRDGNYSLVLAQEDRETQERDGIKPAEPKSHKPEPKEPVIVPPVQPVITGPLEDNFYKFTMDQVRQVLTPDYLRFLEESGYAPNLDRASGLAIEKGILKADDNIAQLIQNRNIAAVIEDNTRYIVRINQTNGRRLVESLGYRLPTTGVMYKLFIPHIKELAEQGDLEAKKTLEEMVNKKAEWLDDVILNKNKVKIGSREKQLVLPGSYGYFDRSDINKFGYPNTVNQQQGEFRYWAPNRAENAGIRNRNSELNLSCNWVPSDSLEFLGVRRAKFFP